MGLDVWEVINAAATKPFGRSSPRAGRRRALHPGRSVLPVVAAREFDFIDRFIEAAGDINFAMPRHVVDLVAEALNDRERALKGAKVGVLGVAFKPNVQDARNSPAADVLAGIAGAGPTCATTTRTCRRSATADAVSARTRRSTSSSTGPMRSSS